MSDIHEDLSVRAGGLDQRVTIRGSDAANPALMILSGPGVAFSGLAPLFASWERDFTVVQWDQPGAGATLARHGEVPLSLERLADDAITVIEAIFDRVGPPVLLGLSGGSMVGLHVARLLPDLLAAYVGAGQFVDYPRQVAQGYADLLARADPEALADLRRIGPPPYADTAADQAFSRHAAALTPSELDGVSILPPDPATWAAALAAYEQLRGEITGFDARRLGLAFDVPMAFIQGEADAYSTTSEVAAYAREIAAPAKAFAVLAGAGHCPAFTGEAFLARLNAEVRPLISGRRRSSPAGR